MQCRNSNEFLLRRLEKPTGPIDVVLDTDAFNEVDDQFALAYLLRSGDKANLRAIYAAPFTNQKAASPAEGMEKSYQEIGHILALCGREDLLTAVYRGSPSYLPDESTPVLSPAAEDLAERAMAQPDDRPLYVVAIGAITNVASALLIRPEIARKIVLVWLGGHAWTWPDTREFNLIQDVAAARVVFGCGVPLVQLPCMGVVTHFATTGPELAHWIAGKNPLCDSLYRIVREDEEVRCGKVLWSRVIWDVTAVAWLLDERFTMDKIVHSPIVSYDGHYSHDETRHLMKYVYYIDRDRVFADLFRKLAG